MKAFLLVLTLASFHVYAGFEKLTVENLDLKYTSPRGEGVVDRVGIGMSLAPVPYPIQIEKTQNSFELTSPYVDFTWKHPLKFIYDLQSVTAKKTSAALGTKKHFVKSDFFSFTTKEKNVYTAHGLDGFCEGSAEGSFDLRLLEDCRKHLEFTIKKVDVPGSFILARVAEDLPLPPMNEMDIPGDNVILTVKNGDYFMQVYISFWVRAGLRAWGHVQYENNRETIAIRVDQIKFGYIPVTSMVMKKLKELIKSPDIKVDPPWIRIKTKRLYENQ